MRLLQSSAAKLISSLNSALIAAALVAIMGTWQIKQSHDVLLVNAENDARNLARSLSQHAARTFEGVDLVLSVITERVESNPDRASLKILLERLAGQAAQISDLVVTDATGDWMADSVAPHGLISSADRSYFQWHRDHSNRDLYIGDALQGHYGARTIIPLSRRIGNADGSFGGISVAALRPEYLAAFYQTVHIGTHGSVALYSTDGHVLVRYPAAPQDANRNAVRMAQSAKDFAAPSGISRMRGRLDGVERVFAFEHVEGFPLVVSAGIAVYDVLSPWRRGALLDATIIAIASIGLVVLGIGADRNRRKADTATRASAQVQAQYRLLAENSTDVVALKPTFAGPRSYVSPSCRSILGWEPDAFAGLSAADSIHPNDVERVAALFTTLTPSQPRVTSQHRLRHREGHYVWVETIFQLTNLGTPDAGVIATARDITLWKNTEDALKESEARYRLLAENSHTLITVKQSLAAKRSYVSPSSRLIVGWEPDELADLPVVDFVHPDDLPGAMEAFGKLSVAYPTHSSTRRIKHKDGRWIWAECFWQLVNAGTPAETVVLSARDVTERYEAAEELKESEARYRLLAHASSDLVSRIDLDGRHTFASPAAFEILGYHPDEMLGRGLLEFVRSDDLESLSALLDMLGQGHCDQARSVLRVLHKSGHDVWVDVRFRLVRERESGIPAEIVSSLRDVTDREALQHRIENANRQLVMAEELAHVGHWRVDLRKNACSWSEGVYRIHGRSPEDYVPTLDGSIEAYHPDDRASIRFMVAEAISQRSDYTSKVRLIRADGQTRYVISRGFCEVDQITGDVVALFGVTMDVTDVALAERRVARESALLETALNNMDQGLVKIAADGTIELANQRFIEMLELPGALFDGERPMVEQIIAHVAAVAQHRPKTQQFQNKTESSALTFALGIHEYRSPNASILEIRSVALSGGAIVSTFTDVTAQRWADLVRRESEERYRILAETTSDVITQFDLHYNRTYASPASRSVLGYDPEELVGNQAASHVHPEEKADVRELTAKLFAGEVEGDRAVTTFRVQHKLGHWIWIEAGMNLVRDAATGAPSSMISSLRDVTERQRAARHLERARAAAEQAAMAKTAFVANMSHELRTPLTGILGIHDLLQQDPALGDGQKRLVGLASASGRSLLNIVNDILDFSKIEAGQLAIESVPFDLRTLVETCRGLASKGLREKPVHLATHFDPAEPGWFIGDPNRMQQVLLNLLTNAIKFTERGTVRIDVAFHAASSTLRVAVIDTGVGIPNEKLPLLFERFSQADAATARRYGGTGLGLAISKQLVELMGGRISVRSAPGTGSCFSFELPIKPVSEGAQLGPIVTSEVLPRNAYRILLAEDNLINQEIIRAMLTSRGHSVSIVSDGAAAATETRTGPPFDLVLMDIQMPGMDGLTATGVIRRREQSESQSPIPIIGLTANAMAEDVQRCLAAGMDGHVAKPIDWPILLTMIDRLMSPTAPRSSPLQSALKPTDDILDQAKIGELERVIGRNRVDEMLAAFASDLERRLELLADATPSVLSAQAHSLISIAGQFGFLELSNLCIDIQDESRAGGGLSRIIELNAAGKRAISVARSASRAIPA